MAEQLGKKETVSIQELLLSQAYEMSALVSLLEKKGLLTRAEIIEEIKSMRNHE